MNEPQNISPRLIRPREAASYIAVSERTLWTLTKSQKIPAIKIGSAVRYCRDDLDAFIMKCRTSGQAQTPDLRGFEAAESTNPGEKVSGKGAEA